jgi:hypothetical protein
VYGTPAHHGAACPKSRLRSEEALLTDDKMMGRQNDVAAKNARGGAERMMQLLSGLMRLDGFPG